MDLLSREALVDKLQLTEGLGQVDFDMGGGRTEFSADAEGNMIFRVSNGSVHEYGLSRDAFVKAARICGIPESYVTKFPDEGLPLLNDHLNYWFSHRDDELKMLVRDDVVVSFVKQSIDYYSRIHMLETIEDSLRRQGLGDFEYDKVHNSFERGTHYAIVTSRQEFMKVGDLVRGGIQVQDHVLGDLPLIVSGYVWRQVCGNGMLSMEAVAKWSRRADVMNLDDWTRQAVEACTELVENEFERSRELQKMPVDQHGSDLLRAIFADYNISPAMRQIITDNIVDEGAENMYDIMNAITAAANHDEFSDDPRRIRQLQQVAGSLATHPTYCPACFSMLHN